MVEHRSISLGSGSYFPYVGFRGLVVSFITPFNIGYFRIKSILDINGYRNCFERLIIGVRLD